LLPSILDGICRCGGGFRRLVCSISLLDTNDNRRWFVHGAAPSSSGELHGGFGGKAIDENGSCRAGNLLKSQSSWRHRQDRSGRVYASWTWRTGCARVCPSRFFRPKGRRWGASPCSRAKPRRRLRRKQHEGYSSGHASAAVQSNASAPKRTATKRGPSGSRRPKRCAAVGETCPQQGEH